MTKRVPAPSPSIILMSRATVAPNACMDASVYRLTHVSLCLTPQASLHYPTISAGHSKAYLTSLLKLSSIFCQSHISSPKHGSHGAREALTQCLRYFRACDHLRKDVACRTHAFFHWSIQQTLAVHHYALDPLLDPETTATNKTDGP